MVKYQILVVEDQEEIRNIVEKYLLKEGYNALLAKDGFEALNQFNLNFALVKVPMHLENSIL